VSPALDNSPALEIRDMIETVRRVAILTVLCAVPSLPAAETEAREFFESKIRPLFARHCAACHSASAKMGGLDMSTRDGLLKGGSSGPSIVPGDPRRSLLIQAVSHRHSRFKMPLQQPRLPDSEIAALGAWVRDGAPWPESPAAAAPKNGAYAITAEQRSFWAFQPVRKPQPPRVKNTARVLDTIDRFLLAKIEEKGVTPAQPADRRTLIRRAYYDLTGLPPSAAAIDAFMADRSTDAFAKVVDSLLRSPRYGERWARYWLDVARYSDDRLESEVDAPYENAFRYRDWVIRAFNDDLPYDVFVKAQIAGDLMGDPAKYAAGLGFYALRPDTQDDRVDVTGRAFLALTIGCAQCHDHKFDPIPTTDFYALQGVFSSTREAEHPLAPEAAVKEYKARAKAVEDKREQIRQFLHRQAEQLAVVLAQQTARYVTAARALLSGREHSVAGLDPETLRRWVKYLGDPYKDHSYLAGWPDESKFDPAAFQQIVLDVLAERKQVDEENVFRRGEARKTKKPLEVVSLKTESFFLWRDLFFNDFYGNQFKQEDDGLLYYGPNRGFLESDGTIERFLSGIWKDHLAGLRAELAARKALLPEHYPFFHTIEDSKQLKTERVRIGGSGQNLGESVPRRFLSILSRGEPQPFTAGAGRLELAEAIASPANPLTARVMVNRIWQHHFGFGIVRTPSDFGFMGERPTHPELLDYLASRFIEAGWSVKAIHREIMLSAAYQASSQLVTSNADLDPGNRLFWRANVRRLDAESLRDSILAVAGTLDLTHGGKPIPLVAANSRRTIYGFVSRRKTDPALSLFDFPNPNGTSEKRTVTITPPQQLFFLNGEFVAKHARQIAAAAPSGAKPEELVTHLYRTVFGRSPAPSDLRLGVDYLGSGDSRLALYAQALLSSNEFYFVN
jgi:mono/diheme cytochrome c family protein